MRREAGMTLTEIMIVLTILAALAGLALPNYFRTIETNRANEAKTNLLSIYFGEKIYRENSSNKKYWPEDGSARDTTSNLGDIMTNLNIEIRQPEFYEIVITGNVAGNTNAFSAVATRMGGAKTFTIDQTGTITEGGNY